MCVVRDLIFTYNTVNPLFFTLLYGFSNWISSSSSLMVPTSWYGPWVWERSIWSYVVKQSSKFSPWCLRKGKRKSCKALKHKLTRGTRYGVIFLVPVLSQVICMSIYFILYIMSCLSERDCDSSNGHLIYIFLFFLCFLLFQIMKLLRLQGKSKLINQSNVTISHCRQERNKIRMTQFYMEGTVDHF